MDLSSSKDGESHRTGSACGSLLSGRSKSRNGGCALSEYSKPYVLFSATDAASAAIDFSRKSVDDGVVDSPPSRGAWRSPVLSASPLEGSQRIEGRHHSPSPGPPSSRTPHRQLYKCVVDDVSVNAYVHSRVQCSSAPGRICVHAIHPRCATVNHLRVEDDQFAASGGAVVSVRLVSELKGVGGKGEHPCLEDTVHVLSSVAPDLECALEARVLCPGHSQELVRPQEGTTIRRELKTKSSNSFLPVKLSRSLCAVCNGGSHSLRDHVIRRTTPLVLRRKREENESFVDWFSRRTSSESLGYTSSRQEDILRAFSRNQGGRSHSGEFRF